jgi:uncharacterized membrane protein HdeD (DUF308 family)
MAETLGAAVRTIWWIVLIRGILLILLGALTLWQPVVSVVAVVLVFAIYAIVDGVVAIIGGIASRRRNPDWGWLIAQGVLAIVAGVLVLMLPGLAGIVGVFAILWFIVASALVTGVMTIWTAARQSGGVKAWGIVAGILDLVFGALLGVFAFLNPTSTATAIVGLVAILAIVLGVFLVITAFMVRRGVTGLADRFDASVAGA